MSAPLVDENDHFQPDTQRKREALRAQVTTAADRIASRNSIADTVGTDDQSIVDRLEQLGFTGDSARIIDLLPLIHVAWADGRVQRAERVAVLAVLKARGIAPGSDACLLVETLLEQRPSETFLGESLALLRELVAKKGGDASNLVDLCANVAAASGGLLGIGGRVSDTERELIGQIAKALGETAEARFRARFEE